MDLTQKVRNVIRGLVQRNAPEPIKKRLWDGEFAKGRWNCLEQMGDESIHLKIEEHANNGGVLDLGCGPGTTSLELNSSKYSYYTGVDISDVAINKAQRRAKEVGRQDRNEYCQSDILTYVPACKYDVILFGESIYYVPTGRVTAMLNRYAQYLTDEGSFLARMFEVAGRRQDILRVIERNFKVVEKQISSQTGALLVVFKPSMKSCVGGTATHL